MSSSSSSSPTEAGGGEGEGGDGGGEEVVGGTLDLPPRRIGDPSSSRRRSADAVWPEHFVEALAAQVAVDAARTAGRLAAAPAITAVFQVCSTWRAVSRSELLWQELTMRVWARGRPLFPIWRDEFVRLHRTASNFRNRRSAHSRIFPHFVNPHFAVALSCRRLALSDRHLAAGYDDGSVHLFLIPEAIQLATYMPHPHRDRLGRFSSSISGLLLLPGSHRLVYASQDGDIHVAPLSLTTRHGPEHRAQVGNLVEDGPLIDFAGDDRWWVGLYAGVPGRSWHVWSGDTEQLVYVGGSLTDPDSVIGWHVLTDAGGPAIGRVRIAAPGITVGFTGPRIQVLGLDDLVRDVGNLTLRRGAMVETADGCDGRVMVVDQRGVGKVYLARTLEEVCRFNTVRSVEAGHQQQQRVGAVGCMNWGYVILCSDGGLKLWDARTGEYMYAFRERIGEATFVTASDRYVAAWTHDDGMHLWDFGPPLVG